MPLALAAAIAGFASAPVLATTYVVNTTGDPGPDGTQSLRQAIVSANASAGNTITFDASLDGGTIELADQIQIYKAMTISGPGASRLTISGGNATRIFLVESQGGPVTFSGLTLANGYAAGLLAGGAIGAFFSPVSVQSCVISGNSAGNAGGGIFSSGADLTITGSRIAGNHAYSGGGVFARCYGQCATLTISQSTISGNTARESGAGVYAYHRGAVSITQSTISGNRNDPPIGQHGGAVFLYATLTTPVIEASTIAGNYSYSDAGGVYADSAYLHFTTVAGNSTHAGESNGLHARSGGSITLQDSIVAKNFSSAGTVDVVGSITANFSLIGDAGSATVAGTSKLIGLDPLLGPLADHGGPTLTMLPAIGSPAVDNGESALPPTLDQRGFPRPVGAKADMGAVERQVVEDIVFRDGFDGS